MNSENTHSSVVVLPDGAMAFIDGIPDTCPHTETDMVLFSASGKCIKWHTYRQWASLCEDARYQLVMEYHQKIGDPILESTYECRKCKSIYHPGFF